MKRDFFKHISTKKRVILGIITLLLIMYVFSLPRKLFNSPYATVITDRNGELLGARIADDGQWRFPISDQVPDKFAKSIILFEDRYFKYHWGVNPVSIGRAFIQNIKNKRVVSGGSTITMQTIRLSRGNKRTIWEKFIETILATRLEFRHSKEEILALYASHAPFGGNVVGIEAAAWRYFGHSPQYLSWAEAALLAVLPNSPSMIHLAKNRTALEAKRNRLLKQLFDENYMDESAYELALNEPLPGEPLPLPQIAPHLVASFHKSDKGKHIASTIDKNLQIRVEYLLERWNNEFLTADIRNIAAIVIDIKQNQVVAYCGNVRFEEKTSGNQVDIIHSPRSSGSILKPFLFCAMLQEGELLENMLLPDIPINISGFSPQNFDKQFYGAVPASDALARSLNVPAVYMLRSYSVPKFYDLLKKTGISTLSKPSNHYGLSLILGGAETTLWDVSSGYCQMARTLQGLKPYPISLELSDVEDVPELKPVFHPGAIWQTFETITGLNRPEEIDWRSIPSMQKIAWKTGTSYGFRDGWAVGVTADYLVGVWVGNANGEGKPGLTGARTAGPVMFDVFNILPRSEWFSIPFDDLIEAEICKQSGHITNRFCMDVDTALMCNAGLKTIACPYHIPINVTEDERFRVYEDCAGEDGLKQQSWFVLPPAQEWYYKQNHPDYRSLPSFKPECKSKDENPMQFIYPQRNTKVFLPKQLDGSKGPVIFELAHTNNDAEVHWHLDDNYISSTRYFHRLSLLPSPGRHSVTVVDDAGNVLSVSIYVE